MFISSIYDVWGVSAQKINQVLIMGRKPQKTSSFKFFNVKFGQTNIFHYLSTQVSNINMSSLILSSFILFSFFSQYKCVNFDDKLVSYNFVWLRLVPDEDEGNEPDTILQLVYIGREFFIVCIKIRSKQHQWLFHAQR